MRVILHENVNQTTSPLFVFHCIMQITSALFCGKTELAHVYFNIQIKHKGENKSIFSKWATKPGVEPES